MPENRTAKLHVDTLARWDARLEPGPPRRIWLSIPYTPPSLNVWSRQHWSYRKRQVDEISGCLRWLAVVERLPCFARARVEVVYYFRDTRRRDPDNFTPKTFLDGIRHAGLISDDNAAVLELPQARFEVDRQAPRTEVWITELEEGQE